MPEQEELFGKENEQGWRQAEEVSGEAGQGAVKPVSPKAVADRVNSKQVERTGAGIAGGVVHSIDPPLRSGSSNRLLLILLLLIALLGLGFVLLNSGLVRLLLPPEVPMSLAPASTPVKMPIERGVEKVVLARQPETVAEHSPTTAKGDDAAPAPVMQTTAASAAVKPELQPKPVVLYSVLVGPFLTPVEREAAAAKLRKGGFGSEITKGRGMVTMIRLREGVYPPAMGRQKLVELRKVVKSAFLMPTGEKMTLFAGSFADPVRADVLSKQLAKRGIRLKRIATEIEMQGDLLLVKQADQETARQIAQTVSGMGLKAQVEKTARGAF